MSHGSAGLSPETLLSLKKLAQAKTPDARRSLFAQMSHLAFGTQSAMNNGERAATGDILLGLLDMAAPEARAELSHLVAEGNGAPQKLLRALAFDDIAIAKPILERCGAFGDDDIIAVLSDGSDEHRKALAAREGLSERVSAAIVDGEDIELVEVLAANTSARMSAATLNKMATMSERSPRLSKLMLARADLPSIVAHRMFWWVRGPMRRQIMARHMIEMDDLEATLDAACRNGLLRPPPGGSVRAFFDLIAAQDYMPISGLVEVLRQGSLEQFAKALGERMAIDRRTALRITSDPGGEAVAMACRAMRAEKGQFMSMFFLMDYLRFGKARPLSDLKHVEAAYDAVSQARAKASVVLWNSLEQAGAP